MGKEPGIERPTTVPAVNVMHTIASDNVSPMKPPKMSGDIGTDSLLGDENMQWLKDTMANQLFADDEDWIFEDTVNFREAIPTMQRFDSDPSIGRTVSSESLGAFSTPNRLNCKSEECISSNKKRKHEDISGAMAAVATEVGAASIIEQSLRELPVGCGRSDQKKTVRAIRKIVTKKPAADNWTTAGPQPAERRQREEQMRRSS